MKIDYYKIYIQKPNGSYKDLKIINSKKDLLNFITKTKDNYLIIGHNEETDTDIIIDIAECKVILTNELKSNIKVNSMELKPKELEKENKQNRAKRKQNLYNETKDYIDR